MGLNCDEERCTGFYKYAHFSCPKMSTTFRSDVPAFREEDPYTKKMIAVPKLIVLGPGNPSIEEITLFTKKENEFWIQIPENLPRTLKIVGAELHTVYFFYVNPPGSNSYLTIETASNPEDGTLQTSPVSVVDEVQTSFFGGFKGRMDKERPSHSSECQILGKDWIGWSQDGVALFYRSQLGVVNETTALDYQQRLDGFSHHAEDLYYKNLQGWAIDLTSVLIIFAFVAVVNSAFRH